MTKIKNLYGLILAGGFSKRMGQDKALLVYHGKPQIEYVHDLLQVHCSQVFLSKRSNQPSYKNIPSIDDVSDLSEIGPLGGILSAMKMYPEDSWLVMACDLPFVTAETLQELIRHRDLQKLATVFKGYQGLPEPLCAIWEGGSYLKILELIKSGIQCPRKVLIKSDIQLLTQSNPAWLDNVNDSIELEDARNRLKDKI